MWEKFPPHVLPIWLHSITIIYEISRVPAKVVSYSSAVLLHCFHTYILWIEWMSCYFTAFSLCLRSTEFHPYSPPFILSLTLQTTRWQQHHTCAGDTIVGRTTNTYFFEANAEWCGSQTKLAFVRIALHCADPHFRLLNRIMTNDRSHFSPNFRSRPGSSRVRTTWGNGHITNAQLQNLFGPIWRPARGSGFGPHPKQLAMTVLAQAKANCTME